MQQKNLHRRKRKYFLLILLLCLVGMTKTHAYNFSAVCETGQTLYYNIIDATNHYVALTCPGFNLYNGWSGYTMPTGDIILPENVQYDGVTYTVTSIRNYAFYYCSGMTGNLTIPNSVTEIGKYAFYGCSGFTGSLTIPNSVTIIGYSAFSRCSNWETIVIETGNTVYDSRNNCNALIETSTNELLLGCKNTNIPNSITSIGSSAFFGCTGFRDSLTIPNSVTTIGSSAFRGCTGFTGSLTIGNSVTEIGDYAFYNCSGFSGNLTIGNSVSTIGNQAFYNCSSFAEVIFNAANCADVTLQQYPFEGCGGSLVIGNDVERIPASMFYKGGFSGGLTIPNSVTEIGNYAFYNCSGFTGNLTIGNSVTEIGTWAFCNCSGFTGSLTISNSVIWIDSEAFYHCSNWETIVIETGNIYYDSRNNCNALIETSTNELLLGCKNTIILNSVTSIGSSAFIGCTGFRDNLTIPNSVIEIGSSAFSGCTGFTGSLTIGNSVALIGSSAFSDCTGFTGSLTIPNSVTDIGYYAFYNCSGFTGSLTIPNSVTWIDDGAFSGCTGFTGSLTIPNSVTTIEEAVFYGCSSFTDSLTIPSSVTGIGSEAFSGCSGFTSMTVFPEAPPTLGSNAFQSVPTSIPVYVPCASLITYQNTSGWDQFTNYLPATTCDSGEIIVTVNPTESGTVTGAGYYNGGAVCTLTATANSGYFFINWTSDGVVVSDSETYSFIVAGDASFVANFGHGVTVHDGTVTNGYVPIYGTYTDAYLKSEAVYPASELSVMNGKNITNMKFYASQSDVSWGAANFQVFLTEVDYTTISNFNGPGTIVYEGVLSIVDGVMEVDFSNPYHYNGGNLLVGVYNTVKGTWKPSSWYGESVTGASVQGYSNSSLGAITPTQRNFLPKTFFDYVDEIQSTHVVSVTINPAEGGSVSGAGTFEEGDTCTLVATPNEGYLFENWTNEGTIVSDSTTYSFIVTEDVTFVANFMEFIVLDTTISAEICHGEDYFENGFEIIQPEVGMENYSMTFHPAYWYDSIVNLTLIVHPTYYFIEDTTLCNATSYTWHGNTYMESGMYYDSLQTVHGCDSIYALSLEFFNTPLGEFTYMTPTNNYPFTSLPITFSWDAVSGAEYYNFYLWNVNDPAPSTPFAGNIYNRSCYVPSLQNHQTYNWYIEAVNTCFSTTNSVRSFSLNIPPTMNVSQSSLNFGEVALNNSNTLNLYVSGNALDDTITMQMTGEDASMFSLEQGSNWNGLTGGLLSVTFSPTTVKYNYTANLVITTGTLTQTVQLTGSLADMYVFNTYVTQDVFEMNSTVPIYGTVMDANNNPASSAEVEVKVTVMNMTRSLFATTEADGHFSVDFVPAYSESGYYTINSGRVGHNSTAVHDDFNIPGMNLVTTDWILWDVVQNETSTGSIVIRNRSQIPLNNIQVTANTLPEGCSFTFQPLSLAGMEEGVLEYSVSGTTPTNGYQEVALVATSSEGASLNFTVWYRCAEPRGLLYASPNNITTTMTKGINKIVDVMLYNNGTGPTGSVYLDLPSVDWLSVVGNDTLPTIAVQDSAYFSLRLSANENTPLVQYTGNIAVNCERGDGLLLPYTIMAVSDSTGTLIVDVTDDYTYNGNGQHLQGATVTVKGYYSLETVAMGLTDSNGLFTVTDIPEGYYRMSIIAPYHAEYQATIQIKGGQTNTQNIYLQYQAITYSWNVVPTEIQDEYTFELIVEYETNVPVPVMVIDMPQTFPELAEGESFVFNYIISNYGLVDAYEATLYPPTHHPLYDFTPLITKIDTLHAQSTVMIPCTMTVRTGQRSPLVYAALNGRGERDSDCPDMAKTEVWSYYYCKGEKVYVKGYRWVQIGSHPCNTPPSTNGGGSGSVSGGGSSGPGGSGFGPGGGGSHPNVSWGAGTPPVTTQQQGCSEDPEQPGNLEDALNEMDGCPPRFNNTPKLPPVQPRNN